VALIEERLRSRPTEAIRAAGNEDDRHARLLRMSQKVVCDRDIALLPAFNTAHGSCVAEVRR
jgi:hypothetical protein